MKRRACPLMRRLVMAGTFLATIVSDRANPGNRLQAPRVEAPSIQLEPVLTSNLSSPLYLTHAHDGTNRLFIVEQPGRIKVLQPGASSPTNFLDITGRVLSGGEQGLLGLAFHPNFSANHRFFVDYTRRPDGATVIAEYRLSASDPNVAETSETLLLTIPQPFSNHNGGMIEFGPDGYLYIGTGDGGSGNDPGNRAQNIDDLLGKILRIDVDQPASASTPYSAPPGNPFFGPTAGRDEIFAYGLRNPWRFSFDRASGRIYAGDVGQNLIEEIDIITPGGNYGWRVFEGTRCTSLGPAACSAGGFIPPVAEYGHSLGRCSITGGYAYRGVRLTLPAGSYVYGDYCSGEIFLLDGGVQTRLLDTSLLISSFGEDESGEIYVVGLGDNNVPGSVYRIANPSAPVPTQIYYPRLVTSERGAAAEDDSEYTGIAVANLDSSDATIRLTAFDTAGSLLTGPGIANPAAMQLRVGQQLPVVDTQVFGAGLSAGRPVGWIKLESSVSRIAGFFLFFNESLSFLDGADASLTTLTSFVLPEIEDGGFTRVHVANPNPGAAGIVFELMKADGMPRAGPQQRTANPNGAVVALLQDLFPGADPSPSDYVRATADKGVVSFEHFGKGTRYAQGLNGQDALSGSAILYAPQYAVGGGQWLTFLTVVNLDNAAGSVTFELFGDKGQRMGNSRVLDIPGRGKLHITDQSFFLDPGAALTHGYVRIASNGPRLAGSVVFGDPQRSRFSSALPLVSTLLTSMVYSQLASNETYFTGLAVLNPGAVPANVTIQVNDAGGNLIVGKTENILAGQRKSQLLTEFFPVLAAQSHKDGYFKVIADRGVASFALFGTHSLSVLCAVPPQRLP